MHRTPPQKQTTHRSATILITVLLATLLLQAAAPAAGTASLPDIEASGFPAGISDIPRGTTFQLHPSPGPWPADYPGLLICGHMVMGDGACGYEGLRLEGAFPMPLSACSWSPTNHPCFVGWITAAADWGSGGMIVTCIGPAIGLHTMLCSYEPWGDPPRTESRFDLACTGWGYGDFGCAWFT